MAVKKILIVDDEPNILRSLTYILEKEGYDCKTASNGEEALKQIKEDKPDLILLDIMIPKVDGMEVCRRVKSSPGLKDIYVIILSAKGQKADKEEGLSCGADEYITKPFSPAEMAGRINEICG